MKHLLAGFAILVFTGSCGKKTQPDTEKSDISNAEVIAVKVAAVSNTNASGQIIATGLMTTENEAKYSFKLGGVIDRIHVKEGQSYKKGALLATLKFNEIDAGIAQTNLAIEKAQRDLTRIENLHRDSVATLEQVQNARTGLEVAKRQLDGLQFNRQYSTIYASASGFVTKKLASEGEVIGAGFPVLAANENTGAGWVLRIGLSDQDWAQVAIGQKAEVQIDAFGNRVFTGKVSNKSLTADPRSGTFQADVQVNLQEVKAALGMYGKVKLNTGRTSKYPRIPYDALIEANGSQAYVFVPDGGTRVRKVPIRIGSFDNQGVQVISGLEGVQEIVISNSAFLSERSSILITR
jgi:RND family efflux transporter MFP subunit